MHLPREPRLERLCVGKKYTVLNPAVTSPEQLQLLTGVDQSVIWRLGR